MSEPVDLPRLRALCPAGPVTMTLEELEELRALAPGAADELHGWRTRFEHDDPDGFLVYRDDDRQESWFVRRTNRPISHTHRYPMLRLLRP